MLTTLSRNWVKVNHFVPWRQCLRFHPQQTHFHSGCSFEVIQVLAVSDGRDGLSTNSIYSIMWQSKKHFFPLLLPSPQSSADIALLPSTLTGFCTFAHCFVSIAPSTLLLSFFFDIDFLYDSYPSFSCMLRFPLLTVAHRAACLVKRMLSAPWHGETCTFLQSEYTKAPSHILSQSLTLSVSRTFALSPCLPGSLAVSLQARRGNGHSNWSSVLSGRKSPAKFLSKLIKCKCKVLCLRKALTCLSDSVAWVYSTYHLILFIF